MSAAYVVAEPYLLFTFVNYSGVCLLFVYKEFYGFNIITPIYIYNYKSPSVCINKMKVLIHVLVNYSCKFVL